MGRETFLAAVGLFEDLGKEVFCFLTLCVALPLLLAHRIEGKEFVDLVKAVGVSYMAATGLDTTAAKLKDLWQRRGDGQR
jgi:hypothetical protein